MLFIITILKSNNYHPSKTLFDKINGATLFMKESTEIFMKKAIEEKLESGDTEHVFFNPVLVNSFDPSEIISKLPNIIQYPESCKFAFLFYCDSIDNVNLEKLKERVSNYIPISEKRLIYISESTGKQPSVENIEYQIKNVYKAINEGFLIQSLLREYYWLFSESYKIREKSVTWVAETRELFYDMTLPRFFNAHTEFYSAMTFSKLFLVKVNFFRDSQVFRDSQGLIRDRDSQDTYYHIKISSEDKSNLSRRIKQIKKHVKIFKLWLFKGWIKRKQKDNKLLQIMPNCITNLGSQFIDENSLECEFVKNEMLKLMDKSSNDQILINK